MLKQKQQFIYIMLIISALVVLSACTKKQAEQPTQQPVQQQTQGNQTENTVQLASSDVMVADNITLGKIFVDSNGMTLYEFTKDTKNISNCNADCAVQWPPLLVKDVPKVSSSLVLSKFGTTTRTDGGKQVTFEGAPLYYYSGDKKAGDVNGQGIGGFWFVYKVAADDLSQANTTPASATKIDASIENFAFAPNPLNINVGTTVTWTNKDSVSHTVTSDAIPSVSSASSSLPGLDSQSISPGKTFSITFNKPGIFNYHCNFHQSMKGQVIIQ